MPATLSFEIELELSGSVSRYYPATYMQPAEGGEVEDLDIEDIGIVELVPAPIAERGSHPRGVWKTTSLLDGIDRNAPEIRKLVSNILAMKGEEAAAEIADEAERRAA